MNLLVLINWIEIMSKKIYFISVLYFKCDLLTASKASQVHRKLLLANSLIRYQTSP